MNPGPLQTLLDTLPQKGSIEWIGIRPARSAPMVSLQQVSINQGDGLAGDRFSGRAGIAACVGIAHISHHRS